MNLTHILAPFTDNPDFSALTGYKICTLEDCTWSSRWNHIKKINELHSISGKVNLPNGASLVAQTVEDLPAVKQTRVQSLGQEDPPEKEVATHSSILAWKIPWTEESGGYSPLGSQRAGHNWVTDTPQSEERPSPSNKVTHSSMERLKRWVKRSSVFL